MADSQCCKRCPTFEQCILSDDSEGRRLHLVPAGPVRRDKRGRRIGRNWWREYNTAIVRDHNDAVAALAETNHQMEPDEFREAHPLLTLKATLIANKGLNHEDYQAA